MRAPRTALVLLVAVAVLLDQVCALRKGARCTSDSMCSSGVCRPIAGNAGESVCCIRGSPNECATCRDDGICEQCQGTMHLSSNRRECRLSVPGEFCMTDPECQSGKCSPLYKDGHFHKGYCCLNKDQLDRHCVRCGEGGQCTACPSDFKLSPDGKCLKVGMGHECSSSEQCTEGLICSRGRTCCPPNIPNFCTHCTTEGKCSKCAEPKSFSEGRCIDNANGQIPVDIPQAESKRIPVAHDQTSVDSSVRAGFSRHPGKTVEPKEPVPVLYAGQVLLGALIGVVFVGFSVIVALILRNSSLRRGWQRVPTSGKAS